MEDPERLRLMLQYQNDRITQLEQLVFGNFPHAEKFTRPNNSALQVIDDLRKRLDELPASDIKSPKPSQLSKSNPDQQANIPPCTPLKDLTASTEKTDPICTVVSDTHDSADSAIAEPSPMKSSTHDLTKETDLDHNLSNKKRKRSLKTKDQVKYFDQDNDHDRDLDPPEKKRKSIRTESTQPKDYTYKDPALVYEDLVHTSWVQCELCKTWREMPFHTHKKSMKNPEIYDGFNCTWLQGVTCEPVDLSKKDDYGKEWEYVQKCYIPELRRRGSRTMTRPDKAQADEKKPDPATHKGP